MTTYKDIRGTHIKTVTTDPPAPVNGQMWYNSTTQVMKGFTSNPAGAWAGGGNLNTAKKAAGGTGTQTAALAVGGTSSPSPDSSAFRDDTDQYNGTSWTELNNINTGTKLNAVQGTYTSAIAAGGLKAPSPATNNEKAETWNGSSWTEVADINSARQGLGGAATQTASVVFGGAYFPTPSSSPPNYRALTESWNGSAWTEVADLNVARHYFGACGTSTAALAIGGSVDFDDVEQWNGSAWTEITDINSGRSTNGGAGSTPAAVTFGGYTPSPAAYVGLTEVWNGSSWTEVADMSTARGEFADAKGGTSGSTLAAGGEPPTSNATEEFTLPATSTVTFTAS